MADVNLPGGVKLSPRVLGIVVVGGLAAGLLWRRFGGGGGSTAAVALPGSLSTGVENLGFDTVGSGAGSNRRDVQGNGITLPVTKWVVTVGGVDYLTDGETLTPIGGTQPVTNRPPVVPVEPPQINPIRTAENQDDDFIVRAPDGSITDYGDLASYFLPNSPYIYPINR